MHPHLERGILLWQQARYKMAEDELRQALASQPDDAYAHALLGLCLAEREQFKEATEEAQHAVHLAPDFAFAHYALAHIWHDRNYNDRALESVHEALRLDSSQPPYFALLAGIHFSEAHWKEALEAAETGLKLDAEDITCNNLRAMALVKLGRKAEAGATIDATLRRNPENAVSHANQGWTYLEKGDPQRALEHFREALRLDPSNEWARHGIVEALKARNIIYGLMLRYFLFMAKFSRRGQWGIVLGAYFGNQILRAIAASSPQLAPWVLPLRIAYGVFALMTWLASPLFNLLLRLDRFGRMVLSRDQIVASNWFGVVLLLAIVSLVGCFVAGFESPWVMALFVFGLLLVPMAGVFRCPVGTPRRIMAWCAGVAGVSGLIGFALTLAVEKDPQAEVLRAVGGGLMLLSIIVSAVSTWAVNILMSRRQRR